MSRSLELLRPEMQERVGRLLDLAARDGLSLLVYCTLRTAKEQADLYAVGRTPEEIMAGVFELADTGRRDLAALLHGMPPKPGRIVTKALPGQSAHNYGLAIDAVPMLHGKPQWAASSPLWAEYGHLVREAGLEWAGDWKKFREYPHAQFAGFDWREEIRRVRT